ncbi:MAG: undecaprenyl/decaprenyl-phosphate alpha-N-acetylglucosaminyl 1-phosphate transferase, partial [Candidatus Hydrogenedentes bacterium]|nr:undecaprenyl/decaprenyl-phosphate alpha-N-acetylglucosaminyl 1-phosphate transferase [Candidatus Hydrogenedentota bacterium]
MLFRLPDYWPRTYLMVGCTAFILVVVLMPLAILLFRRIGMMDAVADNKIHEKPVPRGGGIIIFLAFAVAVLLPGYRSDGMNGILLGAFLCLVVGAVDDYVGGIPGFYKLITLVVATFVLSFYGVRINVFQNDVLDIALTILWIVGVTSAFNGTDNMDGLASGLSVIVAGMFLIIALQAYALTSTETSLSWFGMLAVGLIGANLGFLIYNSKPALIFMGDSGSFFLGFTLAALGVMGEWTENRIISCTIPVLILGVPLFDFAYIIIARIVKGAHRIAQEPALHFTGPHRGHRIATDKGTTQVGAAGKRMQPDIGLHRLVHPLIIIRGHRRSGGPKRTKRAQVTLIDGPDTRLDTAGEKRRARAAIGDPVLGHIKPEQPQVGKIRRSVKEIDT